MESENQILNVGDGDGELEPEVTSSKRSCATTLQQSSVVRWLSLIFLLESIKKSYSSLLVVLRRSNQAHRVHNIDMNTVEKLIVFLDTWYDVLCELQTGNSPSLFLVLPCINRLRQKLHAGMKREKGGYVLRSIDHPLRRVLNLTISL